ncbi:MAG: transglycosylase SLT domain-containing protein [Gammaproteobacteria bacterium]|nr:transglycosylase SLT domain-containing protein [Gammaproteobacteria bacterium]
MRHLWTALALVLFLPMGAGATTLLFPKPAELEPDVAFWRSVFSEYRDDEGVLHDSVNLAVVYERMAMPSSVSRRERNKRVEKRREHYKQVLAALSTGNRNNLSAEEQRVLALWPEDVSNETLKQAAGQIRFQQGLSDRFAEGLRRAGLWRQHVHDELTKYDVPVQLAALPHVESSYNPAAQSHVGASGIWQFTRSTGRRYMRIDHVVDERNDPFLATTAAAKLLSYNYSIAGNWPMAITAYNHGLAGVRRAMQQFGDEAYADILRNYKGRTFGFASRNFYVAFLAAMEIDQDADRYFPGVRPEQPVVYEVFRLDEYVPADALASVLGLSERELASHNPAMQATIWQGSKYVPRDFEVRVPRERLGAPAIELLASIDSGQRFDAQLPDLYHRVASGDTLSEIADAYGTTVSTLVALNSLNSRHRIRAGQQLRLPAAGPAPVQVAALPEEEPALAEPAVNEPSPEMLANAPAIPEGPVAPDMQPLAEGSAEGILGEEAEETLIETLQSALLADPSDYSVASDQTIEVQPLETLGHYADWLGIRTQRLRDINGLAFRTPVEVGQRIKLDFSSVGADSFEELRSAYHRQQQDAFFRGHRITGVQDHVMENGESVWVLALRRYDVPIWLLRQYNPELDLGRVAIGVTVRFPLLATEAG